MSFSQAGACPKCGAPLWVPAVWNSIVPPPVSFSCNCNGGSQTVATVAGGTAILLPPAMQAAQLEYQKIMNELERRKEKAEFASSPEGVLQRLVALEQTVLELCSIIKKLTGASGRTSATARKLLKG